MNLDSNHSYGNRFIKVGDKGFNPAYVTNYYRNDEESFVKVWFPGDDTLVFYNADADLVWEYLTANSTELTAKVPDTTPAFTKEDLYGDEKEELPY
jgi:hypothetical protein